MKKLAIIIAVFLFVILAQGSNSALGNFQNYAHYEQTGSPAKFDPQCRVLETEISYWVEVELYCENEFHHRFGWDSFAVSQANSNFLTDAERNASSNITQPRRSYTISLAELIQKYPHLVTEIEYFMSGYLADTNIAAPPNGAEENGWKCYQDGGPSCYGFIDKIEMVAEDEAWAVIEGGQITHYAEGEWIIDYTADESRYITLTSLSMLNNSYGWAVGYSEKGGPLPLALQWNGTAWQEATLPTTDWLLDRLFSVHVVDENDVWVSGCWRDFDQDLTFGGVLHWDGTEWQTTLEAAMCVDRLNMLSPADGWLIGQDWENEQSVIMRWNGKTWQETELPVTEFFWGFDFTNTEGWALGASGSLLKWDGDKWNEIDSSNPNLLTAVEMVSDDNVWFMGENQTLMHWDGQKFDNLTGPSEQTMVTISMYSADSGFAGGFYGSMLRYDGTEWTAIYNPTNQFFFDISMISATEGWAVAAGRWASYILKYDGVNWNRVYGPVRILYALDMVDEQDGWATGSDGAGSITLHWDGLSWNKVPIPEFEQEKQLVDIDMLSSTQGWIIGNDYWSERNITVLKWDGESWSIVADNFDEKFGANEIVAFAEDDVWIVGTKSVPAGQEFCDMGLPGTASFPMAIHWDGISWFEVAPTNDVLYCGLQIYAADGVAADDFWASHRFRWNGERWYETPPSAFFANATSMDMLASDDGWAVSGYWPYSPFSSRSEIRHWDGKSWVYSKSPTLRGLSKIDMVSPNEGWAVGNNAILHFKGEPPVGQYAYLPLVLTQDGNE